MSPVLSASQLATLGLQGEERSAAVGDVLFRVGDRSYPLIAIIEGEAAVLGTAGQEIVRHGASGFLGEMNLLTGQTAYLTAVVTQPMRYIAVDRYTRWGGKLMDGIRMAKPRVIISVRVSTKEQQEKGFGWDNQMRRLPELVAEQGWEIAKRPDGSPGIYDEGFASTTAAAGDDLSLESRPVMQALLAELAIVAPTFLVCREVDRLHRDTLEWELLQHQLVRAGVEAVVQWPRLEGAPMIVGLSESKDRAFASIQAVFASLQKADMKAKLGAGRRERGAQGLPNGGQVPYGYQRGEPKGPFVVCEADVAVYDQMIGWAIEGVGAVAIANRLSSLGVPTFKGNGRWQATTVRHILSSQAPLGMVRVRQDGASVWVAAAGQPAIITRERWEQAQAVIDTRKRYQDGRRRHALAGLLRCSACGKRLLAETQTYKPKSGEVRRHRYYSCRRNSPDCPSRYAIAESVALKELAVHINVLLQSTTGWVQSPADDDIGEVEGRIGELESELENAREKVKRAHTAYVDAPDDMASIALEELHRRRATLKRLETELGKARKGYAQAMTGPAGDVDMQALRNVLEGWEEFPDDEKRIVLETIVEEALVLPKGRGNRLDVHWRSAPLVPAEAATLG